MSKEIIDLTEVIVQDLTVQELEKRMEMSKINRCFIEICPDKCEGNCPHLQQCDTYEPCSGHCGGYKPCMAHECAAHCSDLCGLECRRI